MLLIHSIIEVQVDVTFLVGGMDLPINYMQQEQIIDRLFAI